MEQYQITLTRRSNGWTVQLAGLEVDVPGLGEIEPLAAILFQEPASLDIPFPELLGALVNEGDQVVGYVNVGTTSSEPDEQDEQEEDSGEEQEEDECRECHRVTSHKLDCTKGRTRAGWQQRMEEAHD